MSLTQAENVFAGIHEDGINDFLRAFFTARPRYPQLWDVNVRARDDRRRL